MNLCAPQAVVPRLQPQRRGEIQAHGRAALDFWNRMPHEDQERYRREYQDLERRLNPPTP